MSGATAKVMPPISLPPAVAGALEAKISARTLKLPLLPAVPLEVSRVAGGDNPDARKLADLISRDQAMAAHLLKLANSPLFRGKVPMVTVQQAVARLGSVRVREAALMIACHAGVFRVKGFEAEVAAQFRHSIATALFAQEIARHRRTNVEEAFLAGLMHDIGRPVLLQALIDLQEELNRPLERDVVLASLSNHHAHIGAEMTREWGMSARLSDTIDQHHTPEPLPSVSELVHTVQLADALAHVALEGDERPKEEATQHPALVVLEIYPDALAKIMARADEFAATAEAIA
jgi:putative nucleotidyltransferase with HDIG domain